MTKTQLFVEDYIKLCKEYDVEIVHMGPDEFIAMEQKWENDLFLQDYDTWNAKIQAKRNKI